MSFYDRLRMDAVNHIMANLMNKVYDDEEFQESISKLDDDEKLDIEETVYFCLKHLPVTEGELLTKEYVKLKEQIKEFEDIIEDLELQLNECRNAPVNQSFPK